MRSEPTDAGTSGDGHGTEPGTRAGAAVVALGLPGLWLWTVRDELAMAVPAILLAALVGLIGGGLWRFLVERRRAPSDLTGYFVSAAVAVTLVSGAAARISGDWRGWHTVLGAVSAGMGVACWLLFLRIALWGLPRGDAD